MKITKKWNGVLTRDQLIASIKMFSNFDENETGTKNIFSTISYIMLSSCVNERSINTIKHNEHNETQSLDKKSDISYLANRNSPKLTQIIQPSYYHHTSWKIPRKSYGRIRHKLVSKDLTSDRSRGVGR